MARHCLYCFQSSLMEQPNHSLWHPFLFWNGEKNSSAAVGGHLQWTPDKEIHLILKLALQVRVDIWLSEVSCLAIKGHWALSLASSLFARCSCFWMHLPTSVLCCCFIRPQKLVTNYQGQLISAPERVQLVSSLIIKSEGKTLLDECELLCLHVISKEYS